MNQPLPRIDDLLLLDMHVHVGPEYLQRRYSAQTLADEARREGFGAVLKNHFQPTTGWVSQVRRDGDPIALVGSVVLNVSVGGVDEHGVRAALSGWKQDVRGADPDPGAVVVWMPTLSAEAHLNLYGRRELSEAWGVKGKYSRFVPIGCGFRLDENDTKVMAGVDRVLGAIAEADLVLATGHLNKTETVALVRRARAAGIRRILMTHPLFQATSQDLDVLVALWRDCGAYTELAYSNISMDHLAYEQYLQVIEAVGTEGVILTSDLGQVINAAIAEGWRDYMLELKRHGVSEDAIARMAVLNPHRILFSPDLAAKAPAAA